VTQTAGTGFAETSVRSAIRQGAIVVYTDCELNTQADNLGDAVQVATRSEFLVHAGALSRFGPVGSGFESKTYWPSSPGAHLKNRASFLRV
jgi:hypothetical protein